MTADRFLLSFICGLWLLAGAALGEDEPGSQDHSLFGRYEGSRVVFYKSSEYDEYALLSAPLDYSDLLERDALNDRSGAEWWKAEGRLTKIRYEIPTGRSSLEVMRNYEKTLKARGFEVLFSCADQNCFKGKLRDPYLLGQQIDADNGLSTAYFDHARYMFVRLDRPRGAIYGSVLTGEDKQTVTAFLAVVETAPLDEGKITTVSASTMQQTISTAGKVNLYGILFDYDKDALRPESKPTLDEIAKLLNANPQLRLEVVGHTDDRGTHDYNMDLSRRRAANVIATLIQDYGISTHRLTSSGAGFTQPVASNDTDEGRSKNRRVELVAR